MTEAARSQGVGVMTVHNSYNCGVLGHHAERIAEAGLLGLCFTNAPASIAPTGGKTPVIGTNPFALGVPGGDSYGGDVAFVIDQSASAIAKSEIMLRNREGEAIEPGWALDADGQPTTDAAAALKGSMVPSGGAIIPLPLMSSFQSIVINFKSLPISTPLSSARVITNGTM